MGGRRIWIYVAGLLTFPLLPYIAAIVRGLFLALAAFFGSLSGAFTAPAPAVAQQSVAAPATDQALLSAIVKMGEGQQQLTTAVVKNTETVGELVTVIAKQQGRQAAPAASAPCAGDCWTGEYIPVPQRR